MRGVADTVLCCDDTVKAPEIRDSPNPQSTAMKTLLAPLVSLLFLSSCVFEAPFSPTAELPVDGKLPGLWEAVSENEKLAPERMLVLQHSENEYVVGYPLGEKSMAFRAFPVKLEGAEYVQIQLIGTAEGPVKAGDRKFHLLKLKLDGDQMELRTIDPEVIGKDHKTTAELLAAFKKHKDDPKLFQDPQKFRRVK